MTSKITTKRGDEGETSLLFGRRVRKTHPRVRANGSLDEFNVALGYVRTSLEPSHEYVSKIRFIQERLFGLMGQVAVEADETERYREAGYASLESEHLDQLDQWVKEHEVMGMKFKGWALPGDDPRNMAFEGARVAARRAERELVGILDLQEPIPEYALAWLNRCSDLLWLMARAVERGGGAA